MPKTRSYVLALLAVLHFISSGSLGADERFTLMARIDRPPTLTNSPLLRIELKNVSPEVQKIRMLKELFEGTVYLRDAWGDVYPFIYRGYWIMMMTATWDTPEVELSPGASHVFRHALSDFIDWRRTENAPARGVYDGHAILSEGFGRGCEIWCEFEIRETKPFGKRFTFGRKTGTLRSPPLVDIRPPLLYDPFTRSFEKNPFVVNYAPLLTKDEQDQFKTGDELFAEWEEQRATERAKYPRPLRSLMEARDTAAEANLRTYERLLNDLRRNPSPKLFHQFAEWVDENTCTVRGMFEDLVFDSHLQLAPWEKDNWRTAMQALSDALTYVKTSAGLERMLVYVVQTQGGGHLEFDIPGTDAKIDIRTYRTATSSSEASGGVQKVSHDLLRRVAEECKRVLRERYPELR
jgi:hypothetical protein